MILPISQKDEWGVDSGYVLIAFHILRREFTFMTRAGSRIRRTALAQDKK